MHLLICLTSFLLTFHLSLLRASNSTQQENLDDTFAEIENATSDALFEINSTVILEKESLSHDYVNYETTSEKTNSLEFTVKYATLFPTLSFMTDLQNQTENDTSSTSPTGEHDSLNTSTIMPLTLPPANDTSLKIHKTHADHSTQNEIATEVIEKQVQTVSGTSPAPSSENVTSFEETVEHNAILTTDFEDVTDKGTSIIVGHKCMKLFQDATLWNDTDGGMLAVKSCPSGYQGSMYRPCFSSGKWGNVDYSECRLEHLGRMRHMILHQVQKGMLGNMYVLAEEFSKYISSVDMKSPLDRLEAFEILNTFLKLEMKLKLDKSRDVKYVQALLHASNELIKKRNVLFSSGSQKNKLITEKAVEMIFDLTYFAERSLRSLLKTQKKQIVFKSNPNIILLLFRGKLSGKFSMNLSSEYERDDDLNSLFNLEKALERSAYALLWVKGLKDLLSTNNLIVNSDIAVATLLSPLTAMNHHLAHPPTFDMRLRMRKKVPEGYTLKCGQLWNMSHLWNTEDCSKFIVKGDVITCRCHHLGSTALLLEEWPHWMVSNPSAPVGKMITISCVTSLSAIILTLAINFFLKRREQSLSVFILINLLVCMAAIQIIFMCGINQTSRFEVCLSFAIVLHYLFLVSCFWVVSYSIYLLQRLRSCMEYTGKIRDYCIFCWVCPSLLLMASFVGNPRGYETKQYCWLNIQRGILWSFVLPVTGLILVNTIIMILALKTFNEQMSVTHRIEICKTRTSMRAGITLLPFFAINWFFGILAVEDPFNTLLQAIFSLTNSMQGILTFIFFCIMDNNVQMSFRLKINEVSKKPRVSSMKLKKSGSFPVLERSLISLSDEGRRNDCTPLLSSRLAYNDSAEDPCCSNIRV